MLDEAIYKTLNGLRNEYRGKMNNSTGAAQDAAQKEDMAAVSMCSTDAERYREAFVALNRAILELENLPGAHLK